MGAFDRKIQNSGDKNYLNYFLYEKNIVKLTQTEKELIGGLISFQMMTKETTFEEVKEIFMQSGDEDFQTKDLYKIFGDRPF